MIVLVALTLAAAVGEHREGVQERADTAVLADRAASAIPMFRQSLGELARAESTLHASSGHWSASPQELAWRAPVDSRVKLRAADDGYLATAQVFTTKPRCAVAVGDRWRAMSPFRSSDGVPACLGDSVPR